MTEALRERTEVERDQVVMPFYLLCDVSYSMHKDMDTLNESIRRLLSAIRQEPIVDDVAQLSILSFSDVAEVILPMSTPSSIGTLPELYEQEGTQYGVAFRKLAETIEADITMLRSKGYTTYRPCAFFLTDGEPNDEQTWHLEFKNCLTYDRSKQVGMKRHPVFVPFGFRDAEESHMSQLAYPRDSGKWYLAKNTPVEDALKSIISIIMNTVITSSMTAHPSTPKPEGKATPIVSLTEPGADSGIVQGNSNYDPDYDPFTVL